ncbi:MAG: hypothetical protein P8104_03380 [Gammaproteobacteria bacterium]
MLNGGRVVAGVGRIFSRLSHNFAYSQEKGAEARGRVMGYVELSLYSPCLSLLSIGTGCQKNVLNA